MCEAAVKTDIARKKDIPVPKLRGQLQSQTKRTEASQATLPARRFLVQVVNFHQADPGRIALAADDGGVAPGRNRLEQGGLTIV
jgi:hypothetical protein